MQTVGFFNDLSKKLREDFSDVITERDELREALENAIAYKLDNIEVPYQKVADDVIEAFTNLKSTLIVKASNIREYLNNISNCHNKVIIPEFEYIDNTIKENKEKGITVDPTLMIDSKELGYRRIKSVKLDENGNKFIIIEIDDSDSYSVAYLTNSFYDYSTSLMMSSIYAIQTVMNKMLSFIDEYKFKVNEITKLINTIVAEESDPKAAYDKLHELYVKNNMIFFEEDSYSSKLFLTQPYSDIIMLTENIVKTFEILDTAVNMYLSPENVKYGIL